MYNRFYFLHIAKTAGTTFYNNVIYPEKENLKKNNIDIESKLGHITKHWCWFEELTGPNSYIFTIFRDPVKRLVSHYAYQNILSAEYNKEYPDPEKINLKNFLKMEEAWKVEYSDYQSKSLLYQFPELYVLEYQNGFKDLQVDKILLQERLNRINLMIKTEDLNSKNFQIKLKNKIFNDLNVNQSKTIIFNKQLVNSFSNTIYNQLSDIDKKRIYENSPNDSEIYFSNRYFWKP
jgi:hypothetical protein